MVTDDVIDDVTWLWKVKVVIPIYLRPVISKTARDRLGYYGAPIAIGNGMHGIEWSRDRWRCCGIWGEPSKIRSTVSSRQISPVV